jgi:hypothetical protein
MDAGSPPTLPTGAGIRKKGSVGPLFELPLHSLSKGRDLKNLAELK